MQNTFNFVASPLFGRIVPRLQKFSKLSSPEEALQEALLLAGQLTSYQKFESAIVAVHAKSLLGESVTQDQTFSIERLLEKTRDFSTRSVPEENQSDFSLSFEETPAVRESLNRIKHNTGLATDNEAACYALTLANELCFYLIGCGTVNDSAHVAVVIPHRYPTAFDGAVKGP